MWIYVEIHTLDDIWKLATTVAVEVEIIYQVMSFKHRGVEITISECRSYFQSMRDQVA